MNHKFSNLMTDHSLVLNHWILAMSNCTLNSALQFLHWRRVAVTHPSNSNPTRTRTRTHQPGPSKHPWVTRRGPHRRWTTRNAASPTWVPQISRERVRKSTAIFFPRTLTWKFRVFRRSLCFHWQRHNRPCSRRNKSSHFLFLLLLLLLFLWQFFIQGLHFLQILSNNIFRSRTHFFNGWTGYIIRVSCLGFFFEHRWESRQREILVALLDLVVHMDLRVDVVKALELVVLGDWAGSWWVTLSEQEEVTVEGRVRIVGATCGVTWSGGGGVWGGRSAWRSKEECTDHGEARREVER